MSSHGKIRSIDMCLIDDLFEMGDGYVLNFSNKTFAEFFDDELGIDIDDSRYDVEGTSKAKRLRFFLKTCDQQVRIQTLLALWEYREVDRRRNLTEETIKDAEEEFYSLIERLGGKRPAEKKRASASQASTEIDPSLSSELKSKLMEVSQLEPQARGYAFEKFLKDLFDANGLAARASFGSLGNRLMAALK
jgi:hypothetical protein